MRVEDVAGKLEKKLNQLKPIFAAVPVKLGGEITDNLAPSSGCATV